MIMFNFKYIKYTLKFSYQKNKVFSINLKAATFKSLPLSVLLPILRKDALQIFFQDCP